MKNFYQNTENKPKTTRRLLAVICVMCMIVTQCFVLVPVFTDQAHAASGLELKGTANNGKKDITRTSDYNGLGEGGRMLVADILADAGVTADQVDTLESEYDGLSLDTWIANDGGKYIILDGDDPVLDDEGNPISISRITFRMQNSYNPVTKLTLKKIGKIKAGETKTLKYGSDYNVKGDEFFKGTGFSDFIEWEVKNADVNEKTNDHITFTAGKAGTTVKVILKETIDGSLVSRSGEVVSKTLTASPTSMSLKVGESKSITVKDDNGTVSSSNLTWSSSKSSVASVSGGTVTGVKKGSATITVKDKKSGLKATVKVTVKEKETTTTATRSTSSYTTRATTRYTYRPSYTTRYTYRPSYTTRYTVRPTTSSTSMTTATRPTTALTTDPTAAPSYAKRSVIEVFLSQPAPDEDEWGEEEWDDEEWEDEEWDEDWEDEDWEEEEGVTLPAAAGSAAVAAAACGAGAVGRIRRFRVDMGDAVKAEKPGKGSSGKGGKGSPGKGSGDKPGKRFGKDSAKGVSGDAAEAAGEKKSKNPLKNLRKK